MTGVDLSLDGAADIAQIALAGLALLALAGAVWQTSSVRKSAREAITYNYFVRFRALETGHALATLLEINSGSDEERRKRFRDMSVAERLEVLVVPNLCEELGGVYKHGMVERGAVKTAFGHTVKVLWDECRWLIESVRREDSGYYRDWQNMLIDMGYLPAETSP
jgi:hypothetical protein